MFRFSCRVGGVSALVSQLSLSHCSATANTSSDSTPSISNSKSTNNDKEFVAVFFTKQSKEFMKAQLEQLGVKDATVSYACINSNSKPEDSYVFKPLFGDRAAFRLKGIIKTDDGKTVGYGKVTNMIGEIRETELAVSMPISSSPVDDETLKRLLHLPSRLELFSGHHNKTVWKGRLPGATVNNHYYPAEKVTVVALPPLKHVVVDGYICSDKYLGDDGNCLFDRSEIVYESDKNKVANEDSQSTYTDHSNTDISSHTANKIDTDSKIVEDNDECPVCRYMKSGPCKEEFLLWDACIQSIQENEDLQKCHQITFNMMNCMRKYEHYDIMTAGTSYDKLAVLDSSNEHTADTTLTVLENTEEKNEKA